MAFLGHENQEVDFTRRKNNTSLLPKYLYMIAKDVPIYSEWLFSVRVNNMKTQKKSLKVD